MSPPVLGHTVPDSAPLEIDLERLVGSHAAVMANSGGGKSGLIRKLLEITHGRILQIVLDAEDEFYTLRERHEYLIAGGAEGDCPATVANAADLALTILRHGISTIVQLNDLHASEQERFIAAFLVALLEAPRDLWRPVLVVIDEAQRFAPQDSVVASSEAVRDLTARGRKRGFTAVLATHRIANVDKNVTGHVTNWFMGRVGQAVDRRVVADSLGFSGSSADARGLLTLPVATFWGFGPAVSPAPLQFVVDRPETTMVKAGQARALTPPAGEALREILVALAKPAAALPVAPGSVTPLPAAQLEAARKAGHDEGFREGFSCGARSELRRLIEVSQVEHATQVSKLKERLHSVGGEVAAEAGTSIERPVQRGSSQGPIPVKATPLPKPLPIAPAPAHGGALGLVEAAARFHPARMTWGQIATIAGRKPRGGHFNASRKSALDKGFLVEVDGLVRVTEAGLALAGVVPPSGSLADIWAATLPQPAAKMFDAIRSSPGVTAIGLASVLQMQPRGGHWNTGMATLRRNELVRDDGGRLYLTEGLT